LAGNDGISILIKFSIYLYEFKKIEKYYALLIN
jgi:hypothetical protein